MTTTVADLEAKIGINGAQKAKSDLKDVHSGVKDLADGFKTGLGAVTGFLTGFAGFSIATDALGFLKDQMLGVLQAGMDQQKVMAQTAAVIKSTGGAAHVSAQQVNELADHYAQLTGISDDTVQSAENLILTFTDIKSNIFPQTTGVVLDMATAMHEDLNSAAIQVGKALQDPIQGATALRRVGVQLSDQQQKLIKHFVDTGQKAKAQGVILKELTKEFGGSAEAAGKTLPGQLARLNVAFDQAKEKIGLAVIPILESLLQKYAMPLADWLGAHLPAAITTLTNFIDNTLMPSIQGVMDSPVVKTLEGWATAIINKVAPAVGSDNKGLSYAATHAKDKLHDLDKQTDTTGKGMVGPFVTRINTTLKKVDDYTNALGPAKDPNAGATGATYRFNKALSAADKNLDNYSKKQTTAKQAAQQSIPVISGIGEKFGEAGKAVGSFVDGIVQRFPAAMPQIKRFGDFIGGVFQGALPGLQNLWNGFWGTLAGPVKIAFDSVQGFVNTFLDMLSGNWDQAVRDTENMNQRILNDLKDFGASIGRFLIGGWQAAIGGWIAAINHFPDVLAPELKKGFDKFGQAVQQGWKFVLAGIQTFINNNMPHIPGVHFDVSGLHLPGFASGGSPSGDFIGAEQGPELLVTPGVYHAPPGSYVYNAQQTAQMLSGNGNGGTAQSARMGNTYVTNVYPQQAMIDTRELARIQHRRDLLTSMGVR